MANKLKKLQINRVDLVDSPSNPLSRVVLYKRADFEKNLFGAKTTDGVINAELFWQSYYKILDSFTRSVDSILYDSELEDKKRVSMLKDSVAQAAKYLTDVFNAYPVAKGENAITDEEQEIYDKVEKTVDVLNELDTLLISGEISVEEVEEILEGLEMAETKKQNEGQETVETLKTALTAKDAEITKSASEITTLKSEIEKLTAKVSDFEKKAADAALTAPEDIWKGVNIKVKEQFEALQKAQKEAEEKVAKAEEDAATTKLTKRVSDDLAGISGSVEEKTVLLRKAQKLMVAEDFEKLFVALKSAAELIGKSALLEERGRGGNGAAAGSALEKIKAKAMEFVASKIAKSEAEGFEMAVSQDPELYKEYLQEGVN